jgi:hypothetical protein
MNTEEARPIFRWAPLGRASAHRFASHTISNFEYRVSSIGKYQAARSTRVNTVASVHFSLTFRKSTVPTLPYNMRVWPGPGPHETGQAGHSRADRRTGIVAVVPGAALLVDGSSASGRDRRDRGVGPDPAAALGAAQLSGDRARPLPAAAQPSRVAAVLRHAYGSGVRTASGCTTWHC